MSDPREFTLPLPTLGGKQLWADEFVHRRWRIQRNVITGVHRLLDPRNVRLAGGTFERCEAAFDQHARRLDLKRQGDHVVILLHGIFRAKEAWAPMSRGLKASGFEPEPVNYPSTQGGIEQHADQVERLLGRLREARVVSFVTHSMGGLVARELLSRDGEWRSRLEVNRLVLIATPNRGAQMADHLLPLWAFRRLAGPAAAQLTTQYVPELPPPTVPFGIVAGVRGDGRGFNPLLEGEDDATVSLSSTHLDGAEDRLEVQAIHTFIMQTPAVVAATIRYLQTGRFLV